MELDEHKYIESLTDEEVVSAILNKDARISLVANSLLSQKNKYSHLGLIYNLAQMRIINNEDVHIARSFLEMLVIAGYEKANKLLNTID